MSHWYPIYSANVTINIKWASVILLCMLCLFLYNSILRFEYMSSRHITTNR